MDEFHRGRPVRHEVDRGTLVRLGQTSALFGQPTQVLARGLKLLARRLPGPVALGDARDVHAVAVVQAKHVLQRDHRHGSAAAERLAHEVGSEVDSPAIVQRFQQFFSYLNSPAMSDEGLAQNFGDTYWYYYLTSIKR